MEPSQHSQAIGLVQAARSTELPPCPVCGTLLLPRRGFWLCPRCKYGICDECEGGTENMDD
jgi:hypothetical protein